MTHGTAITIAISVTITMIVCAGFVMMLRHFHPEVLPIDRRRTLTPTFILLIVSIVMNGFGLLGVAAVTTDTNQTLTIVKSQTSPERQAEQEEVLNGVLVTIDCNGADRLQRGFDALSDQGLIQPVNVTEGCGETVP